MREYEIYITSGLFIINENVLFKISYTFVIIEKNYRNFKIFITLLNKTDPILLYSDVL